MSVKVFHQLMNKTFKHERKFQIFILESSMDFIPRGLKKPIYKEYLKTELYEKYGSDAFLIPEERLFPIINILSQKTLKNSITLIIIITFHTNNLKKLTVYNNTFFMSPINYNISQ